LDEIHSVSSKEDLAKVAADLHLKGIRVFFSDYVAQDDKNSAAMAFELHQGGLGMPNRDYYFNTDTGTAAVRKAYQQYLVETFQELGADSLTAVKRCQAVFALETRLARASRKRADLRDPYKNYHKMDLATLKRLTPAFDWAVYFERVGAKPTPDSVIVGQPEFFAELNAQLGKTSLEDWKNYLSFILVYRSAPYLDSRTYGNYFAYAQTLSAEMETGDRCRGAGDR
jgi:putative endopeptidase